MMPLSSTTRSPSVDTRVAAEEPTGSVTAAPRAGTPIRACGAALTATGVSPPPVSAASAASMISVAPAVMAAWLRSASACTQAIELPGRMSWNWSSSTISHSSASRSYG